MKRLSILGSTGSIGCSTLNAIDLHPERFEVVGLAAGANVELMLEQVRRYRPRVAALFDETAARLLQEQASETRVVAGLQGVLEVACESRADTVVAAITGAAGLRPTFSAILEGKAIALANKETLVMAGDLIMKEVSRAAIPLLPVDSEHNAIHQCLRGARTSELRRILLTASGGPFLNASADQLEKVTAEEALRHPTWEMGPKISIDSATLMNKGLEVIEAHHLFGVSAEQISIVIHPQSVVHSMVEFVDGNILAQMSITDMRAAILYALSYPDRLDACLPSLDLFSVAKLEFQAPDPQRFPCIRLAYEALRAGGTYPAVLNAANEVAVASFLEGGIGFAAIPRIIEETLEAHKSVAASTLDAVFQADRWARRQARSRLGNVERRVNE